MIFQLAHHGFQTLFKVATVACARKQRAHIKRIDNRVRQHIWCLTADNLIGQALCNGRFTNARVTHQQRVVLAATAQHLNAALNFVGASDQRINIAFARLHVQIYAVFIKRTFFGVAICDALGFFFQIGRAFGTAVLAVGRVFCNAVCDEVHRIIACHVLGLQEVGCVAFAFCKNRHQNIGACHFGAAR